MTRKKNKKCLNCKAPCVGKLCRTCFEAGKREFKRRYRPIFNTEEKEESH